MAKCETCKHWNRHHKRDACGHCSFWDDNFIAEDYYCDNHSQKETDNGFKKSGARKHGEIAKVVADMLKITPLVKEQSND